LCINIYCVVLFCYHISMNPQQVAAAQDAAVEAGKFVDKVNSIILFPLIALLSGIAFLYFIYGGAVYIMNANNDSAREEGKKNIMYGIIGLVIMLSAYALLTLATNTFGLGKQLDCAKTPEAAGCEDAFKID
jgi:Type IV secretion system pilin